MKVKRIHYGFSINIQRKEHTYLDDTIPDIKMELIPEISSVLITSTSARYGAEQVLTPLYNVKYIAFEGDLNLGKDDFSTRKEAKGGAKKKDSVSEQEPT